MRRLALAMAALATAPLPQQASAFEVRPATQNEFRELLLGCWAAKSGETCFEADGTAVRKVFVVGPEAGYGYDEVVTFDLANDRLVLEGDLACDAYIDPRRTLTLRNCEKGGHRWPQYDGEFRYVPTAAEVLSGCWRPKENTPGETWRVCFDDKGGAETSVIWSTEGFGSPASYTLEGERIRLATEWAAEGWLWGETDKLSCRLDVLSLSQIALTECDHGIADKSFVRAKGSLSAGASQ